MGTGYVRNDTSNNIDDDKVINAADFDGEFNAIVAAFDSSTGHTHDGTSAEGAPITVTGPAQEYLFDGVAIYPKSDDTYDLGKVGAEFKDLYIDGVANIDSLVANTADINGGTIDGVTVNTVTIESGTITGITDLAITDGGTGASTAAAARTNLGLVIGTDVQAYDAGLASIAGLTTAANKMIYTTALDTYAVADLTAFGRSLIDDADAGTARTTLGLGTISTQASNSVSITGGTITGITDLGVADGGTGASNAAGARTNLGLGSLATQDEGGGSSQFRDNAANDARYLIESNNLSDLTNAGSARSNLGLGSMATQNSNSVSLTGSISLGGNNVTNVSRVHFDANGGAGDFIEWSTGNGLIGYENGSAVFRLGSGGGGSFIDSVGAQTTANGANVNVATSSPRGLLRRSTSSGSVKTNVETVTDTSVIDQLRPVTFTSLLPGDDPDKVLMGFIAEEVAEACPPADMEENYDQRAIIALLVAAMKEARTEIADLKSRVAALEMDRT